MIRLLCSCYALSGAAVRVIPHPSPLIPHKFNPQIPNSKSQTKLKFQTSNVWCLVLEIWCLFVIWCLAFGVCLIPHPCSSSAAVEFRDERNDLLLQDFGRHRPDALVADHALLVDDVGFRHAVDAVVDADPAVRIDEGCYVWVAEAPEPGDRVVAPVLV